MRLEHLILEAVKSRKTKKYLLDSLWLFLLVVYFKYKTPKDLVSGIKETKGACDRVS